MRQTLIFLFLSIILFSCKGRVAGVGSINDSQESKDSVVFDIKYAKGFTVKRSGNGYLVTVKDPQKEGDKGEEYLLAPANGESSVVDNSASGDGAAIRIEIPVNSVICMTSLQLSGFIKLGSTDIVSGIASARHLFNTDINRAIQDGRTKKIGIEGNFDSEIIMDINPDLIFVSPFKRGGYESLKNLGIPLMLHLGYKETSPLGQAEWIKLIGLIIGQEQVACEIFKGIEERYLSLKSLTTKVDKRPVVFSGELRGGNWYVVGGRSFLAELFRDAGADYFLKDDMSSGGLFMDFESVYAKAASAPFWRLLVSYEGDYSYDVLGAQDSRYRDFDAFKNRGAIVCNLREHPFYENSPMEPDVVLADLIKAFHPDLLEDYSPEYYSIMKK